MPDIAKVLKAEVSRVARRETKKALASASKPAAGLRRTTAGLKRRVALLEKELRAFRKTIGGLTKGQPLAVPELTDRARITAKGMRSLRRRVRLSGQQFAKLLGVTPQVVYFWEKSSGPLRVRRTTRAAILAIRGIGVREARRRLDEMIGTKKPGKTPPRRGRRAPKGTT